MHFVQKNVFQKTNSFQEAKNFTSEIMRLLCVSHFHLPLTIIQNSIFTSSSKIIYINVFHPSKKTNLNLIRFYYKLFFTNKHITGTGPFHLKVGVQLFHFNLYDSDSNYMYTYLNIGPTSSF